MLDLFCVRPIQHNTAGITEKQAFIGGKQSICFSPQKQLLPLLMKSPLYRTKIQPIDPTFIKCNNDFFAVKTSLEFSQFHQPVGNE